MSRRAARFTQADVARAIRAAGKASVPMAVEIDSNGTIRIIPANHRESPLPHNEAPTKDEAGAAVDWLDCAI